MIRTVVKVLNVHQSDWNNVPAFTSLFAELQTKLSTLETLSVEQQNLTIGVRAGKEQARAQATDKAEVIARALQALAATTHDQPLLKVASVTRTNLLKANANQAIQLFITLRDASQEHAEALQDYGITAEQIQEFSGICETLPAVMGATRSAIVNRKERTETAAELLNEIVDLLHERMDKLAALIRTAHPETYKQYKAARTVVDLKGKSRKPKDPATGGPSLPPHGTGQLPPPSELPLDGVE